MYRKITYSRKCDRSSGIALRSISDTIRNIEFLERTFDRDVIKCLEYCKELYLQHHRTVWKNAEVTILGRYMNVLLVAGDGLSRFSIHLDKDGDPTHTETLWPSHLPPPLTERREPRPSEAGIEHIGQIECKPYITFKHIKDVFEEKASRPNIFSVKNDVKRCLRYCYGLLKEKDSTVWKNARISIYGENLTIIFASGRETHCFDVAIDDRGEPVHFESKRHIDCELEKKCESKITCGEINTFTNQLIEGGQIWMTRDILLFKYCYNVIEEYPKEVWSDAEITLICSKNKVRFQSGEGKFKFEVVLGLDDQPKCLQTGGPSVNKIGSSENARKHMAGRRRENTTIKCKPFISFKHVQEETDKLEERYDNYDELNACMLECTKFIKSQSIEVLRNASINMYSRRGIISFEAGRRKTQFDIMYTDNGEVLTKLYTNDPLDEKAAKAEVNEIREDCGVVITFEKVYEVLHKMEHGWLGKKGYLCLKECKYLIKTLSLQDLCSCQIRLYCEHVVITFVSGKGFNHFDIIDDGDGNILTKSYTEDDLDQAKNPRMDEVINCSEAITVEDINKLLRRQTHSSNEDLRKCLQHCITLLHSERAWIWKDAEILVSTNMGTLKFLSKNGTNKYRVCLDEMGNPAHYCEASSYRKKGSDFLKGALSTVTNMASAASGLMGTGINALRNVGELQRTMNRYRQGELQLTDREQALQNARLQTQIELERRQAMQKGQSSSLLSE